ncbi:MAG: hypothetical protein NTV54_12085 [Ignavibacteriales bacterium]|nr:hypothetical protein [Ignavibacteriales bacterium]
MRNHSQPFLDATAIILLVCASGYALSAPQFPKSRNSTVLFVQDNGATPPLQIG